MERLGGRVKVLLVRTAVSAIDEAVEAADGKKVAAEDGSGAQQERWIKAKWLHATVEAFRPSSRKHLVVFDIVYGRCVRGGFLLTESALREEFVRVKGRGFKCRPLETYMQKALDRKAILVVPSRLTKLGVVCQPWARVIYYEKCVCNKMSVVVGARHDVEPQGMEDATNPFTESLRWAAWLDLKELQKQGILKIESRLPLACICRQAELAEDNPSLSGEKLIRCSKCEQKYHRECIDLGSENRICPFCEMKDQPGPRRPSCLSVDFDWQFWTGDKPRPAQRGSDDLPVPDGEWMFCLHSVRHLLGAGSIHLQDWEADCMHNLTDRHIVVNMGMEAVFASKEMDENERKRKLFLLGEEDRNVKCASGFLKPVFPSNLEKKLVTETFDWEKCGEGRLEEDIRMFSLEENSTEQAVLPNWLSRVGTGRLELHSPRGGLLGFTDKHWEVEYQASSMVPGRKRKEVVHGDGTRLVQKQVGSRRTGEFSCARSRPRSDDDFQFAAVQPGRLLGPFEEKQSKRLKVTSLYEDTFVEAGDRVIHSVTDASKHAQRRSLLGVSDTLDMEISTKHLALGREKRLRFGRSNIHAWGVFAEEPLQKNDFVIEYKGELIRPVLTDIREKYYEEQGITDYMFRIDNEIVCDATQKGSLARFINHSCDPNCFTSIISHRGANKIVIYAKRNIEPGEELAYDYKFPIETDPALKVPCTCGAPNCRRYMN